jgi:hypothetical protein
MAFEVLFSYSIVAIIGIALILAARVHPLVGLAAFILGLQAFTVSVPMVQRLLAPGEKSSSQESLGAKPDSAFRGSLLGRLRFH